MASFSQETIERVKAVSILDVAGHYLDKMTEESGGVYKAACPFHDDTNASLALYTGSNSFYCFGCEAGKGGSDVISFVQKIEQVSFPEAIEIIARRHGVPIQKDGGVTELDRRLLANQKSNEVFVKALKASVPAQRYLLSRLPDKSLWRAWGIGMVPKGDRFFSNVAGRLSFPIKNIAGKIIGWEFRSIDGERPKTRCSPESIVFNKQEALPGIHRIKHMASRIILVEGFLDMLSLEMRGVQDACALIGSRLYQGQVELIKKRLSPDGHVLLLLDGDKAGRKGTAEATILLEEAGVRSRVIRLPDGMDPDEWARSFRTTLELEEAFAGAKPLIHLQMAYAYGRYLEKVRILQKQYSDQMLDIGRELASELSAVLSTHPKSEDLEYYRGWADSLIKDPMKMIKLLLSEGSVGQGELEEMEVRNAG